MATVDITQETVEIRLSRFEKFFGILRDADVPISSITDAEVVDPGLSGVRGLRAPGLGLPGRRMIGTWRRRGATSLVCVRRGQPALRLAVDGWKFDEVLVGADDADQLAARLVAAGR